MSTTDSKQKTEASPIELSPGEAGPAEAEKFAQSVTSELARLSAAPSGTGKDIDLTAGHAITTRAETFENLVLDAQRRSFIAAAGSSDRLAIARRRDVAVVGADVIDAYARLDAAQLRMMPVGEEREEAALLMASVRSDDYVKTLADKEPDVLIELVQATRRYNAEVLGKETRKAVDPDAIRVARRVEATGLGEDAAQQLAVTDIACWRDEDSRRVRAAQMETIADRVRSNETYAEAVRASAPEVWAALRDEVKLGVAVTVEAIDAETARLQAARLSPGNADDNLATKPPGEANVVERNVRSRLLDGTDDTEAPAQDAIEQARRADLLAAVERRHLAVENKFYARNRPDELAFIDHGKRLTSPRNDDVTIKSMIDIASAKGWHSIEVKGDDVFKQRVWREAQARGIEVKGYRANDLDRAHAESTKLANEVRRGSHASEALTVVERAARGKGYTENEITRVVNAARGVISKRAAEGSRPIIKVVNPAAPPQPVAQPTPSPTAAVITPQWSISQ